MALPPPQSIVTFPDKETFVYKGDVLVGVVPLPQFLSTMPPQFAVGVNVTAVDFLKGSVIGRGPADTGFVLADDSSMDRQAIGLACDQGRAGLGVTVQLVGQFCLLDWTAIAGTQKLTPRTTYYLSAVPGKITSVVPAGPVIQRIGYSISPNVLNLNLEFPGSGGGGGAFGNIDGGRADEVFGGVVLSPVDGGNA